jgi:hypothetical protein
MSCDTVVFAVVGDELVVEDKAALMERYHSGREENMG